MSRGHPGVAAAALAFVLLGACATAGGGSGVSAIEPRDGRSGLRLSGTIGDSQFAVNDGAPVLRLGDCDVNDGTDTDLCFFTRELDGGFFAIIVENPDVVREGRVEIGESACVSPHCDDEDAGAIVEVQFEPGGKRTRLDGGHMTFTTVEDATRYAGTMNVTLDGGSFAGEFEVVPRPEEP